MRRQSGLAFLFPATMANKRLPAICQVNEYQFSANTITITPSNYTYLDRSYPYYTTTQPQTT